MGVGRWGVGRWGREGERGRYEERERVIVFLL